jgi:hypothetical protein
VLIDTSYGKRLLESIMDAWIVQQQHIVVQQRRLRDLSASWEYVPPARRCLGGKRETLEAAGAATFRFHLQLAYEYEVRANVREVTSRADNDVLARTPSAH